MKPHSSIGYTLLAATITALCLWTVSCTHKPVHPFKDEKAYQIDHEACEVWAREGIRDDPDTYNNFDEMKLIKSCMKQKGWKWERTDLLDFEKSTTE